MAISFVIKNGTFENKVIATNSCSTINRHKQALALHAHLLRVMNAALWSGHSHSSFSWGVYAIVFPQNIMTPNRHGEPD